VELDYQKKRALHRLSPANLGNRAYLQDPAVRSPGYYVRMRQSAKSALCSPRQSLPPGREWAALSVSGHRLVVGWSLCIDMIAAFVFDANTMEVLRMSPNEHLDGYTPIAASSIARHL
jgi:hypothetical protein